MKFYNNVIIIGYELLQLKNEKCVLNYVIGTEEYFISARKFIVHSGIFVRVLLLFLVKSCSGVSKPSNSKNSN